jgi:hypothetical protein
VMRADIVDGDRLAGSFESGSPQPPGAVHAAAALRHRQPRNGFLPTPLRPSSTPV